MNMRILQSFIFFENIDVIPASERTWSDNTHETMLTGKELLFTQ